MEKLEFDSGLREYALGQLGILRFNPADPNLYRRFLEGSEKIRALEQSLQGEDVLAVLDRADRELKQVLDGIFGEPNRFEVLLQGMNLLAVGDNGQRLITNLLTALEPVLVEGARRCAQLQVQQAKQAAEARRAAQC